MNNKHKINTASQRRSKRKFSKGIIRVLKNVFAIGILILIGLFLYPQGLLDDFNSFYKAIYKNINFKLTKIDISGNDKLSIQQIEELSALQIGGNLIEIDLKHIKENIEKEPWIHSVIVSRHFPNTINILIEEEEPYSVYQSNEQIYFVSKNGKIIEEIKEPINLSDYLVLSGAKANEGYNQLLDIIYKYPTIYNNLSGLEKVGERRWNIILSNGMLIKLPEHNIGEALTIFGQIFEENQNHISSVVDLRLIPAKIYTKI